MPHYYDIQYCLDLLKFAGLREELEDGWVTQRLYCRACGQHIVIDTALPRAIEPGNREAPHRCFGVEVWEAVERG